jgi:endonuclease/exonuclease/phosphatase family metal-dependent hydrolase
VKILTLNTWNVQGPWRERWEVVTDFLNQVQPDIAAFQEIFDAAWAEEIRKRAGFLSLVFGSENSGLVFLSRFPVTRWEILKMKAQSSTEDYSRYILFSEFEIGRRSLICFNTHLSWKPDEGEIRARQVDELIHDVELRAVDREAAVMGDFNAPPMASEIRKMTAPGRFEDAFGKLHAADPGFTWDNRNLYASSSGTPLPDRRIDYLFYKNGQYYLRRLQNAELVLTKPNLRGVFGSDHFGVLVTFSGAGDTD